MNHLYTRFVLHVLSVLLAAIPATWAARWGLSFDGATLALDLTTALSTAIFAGVTGLGLSTVVFAIWGTGGLPGYLRTVIYSQSGTLATALASWAGWGVSVSDGIVLLHLPTLASAIFAGGGVAAGILRRWGVR